MLTPRIVAREKARLNGKKIIKEICGERVRYDGIQDLFPLEKESMYQWTCLSGIADGATFLTRTDDYKAVAKRLNEMIEMRKDCGKGYGHEQD